ncbi:MAG: pyrroloquinoline quinone biosynthesis peptide chaperone PqqD [Deltaproteobacteria bacterium]|nr:pyrroloquinoline quinone biosynthesis peptide chaperone PqqD [Deltaproteobacteria bacterium]
MKTLQRNPDIVWRVEKRRQQALLARLEAGEDISEEGTVILLLSGMMHQLNLLGGHIWILCDGQRTLAAIVDILHQEFAVERAELEADVQEFVDDLLQRGWLNYAKSTD